MRESLACAYDESGSIAANGIDGIGERLAFMGFPSKRATQEMSGSAEDALKGIACLLEQIVVGAIEKGTAADFRSVRDATFDNYARLMRALGFLIRAVVPANILEQVTAEAIDEMEADLKNHALAAFGSNIRDQSIFTVWTFRKISGLCQKIVGRTIPDDLQEQEKQFATMSVYQGLRARFHLDCLMLSMRTQRPIYPEVLEVLSDGLRSAVEAYACIRQVAELRMKYEEPVLEFVDMDDEDKLFVESSAYDMAKE
jgi:hypothetical protein